MIERATQAIERWKETLPDDVQISADLADWEHDGTHGSGQFNITIESDSLSDEERDAIGQQACQIIEALMKERFPSCSVDY